ncbi:hypothetical protein F7725_013928 [Dissostichus mawsoni]|uniref:PH domain-containing protein n=1 Tax=Dissostichus mawsoni TaxID=36200 RepID=A0A7J5YUW8_DISMA|nr:hypothetical protein F7725_013928 [Dissostichus mawsoni]
MKEGFMEKTGPKHTEGFKKRWFTMDDRRLMYFKDPLGHHWSHGITIVTPDRKFLFACETEAEQRDWISAFQRVINRPMRPQEYAVGQEAVFCLSMSSASVPWTAPHIKQQTAFYILSNC